MDRRTFLRRPEASAPPASAPSAPTASAPRPAEPPFEYAPGRFAPGNVGVRWRGARPERPATAPDSGALPLATTAGLDPFVPTPDAPWDRRRAAHLLRRTGFGADRAAITALLAQSPLAAVDALVDAALAAPPLPLPPWVDAYIPDYENPEPGEIEAYDQANVGRLYETQRAVFGEMLALRAAGTALRERLALVWHNHFVTGLETYFHAPWLERYWRLLRSHAFGDFRAFVADIGRTPAMLIYLNGIENRAGEPNENYARELLELFTMGIRNPAGAPNYTQTDVAELARTLTGWTFDVYGTQEALFVPPWHDSDDKTIFGQTGPWGYDDVNAVLFEARGAEIAHHVCRKLYRAFVYAVPDEAVVAAMAAQFRAGGYQIAPVVRTLLRSAHFFDAAALGAQLKSPLDAFVGFHREAGLAASDDLFDTLGYLADSTGQILFQPPNVAGWPGHRQWIDTGTLAFRWLYAQWLVYDHLDEICAVVRAMPDSDSAALLAGHLAAFFVTVPLSAAQHAAAVDVLLDGLPPYEWDPTGPGSEYRIAALVLHLMRLPEFQLT